MDHPDGMSDPAPGKGREVPAEGASASGLVPYVPADEVRPRRRDRARRRKFLGVLSRAGLVAAGLGVGGAAAAFVLTHGLPVDLASVLVSKAKPEPDPRVAESEALARRLTDSLDSVRAEVSSLRASLSRDASAQVASLEKKLDALASRLDTVQSATTSSLARLTAEIGPIRQETSTKLQSVLDRLDRSGAKVATEPAEPARPQAAPAKAQKTSAAATETAAKKPPVIKGWVLRGVYDGLALVEGADGTVEVAPGELLPGAGRVKSIERSSTGWIVVTSHGVIDRGRGSLDHW